MGLFDWLFDSDTTVYTTQESTSLQQTNIEVNPSVGVHVGVDLDTEKLSEAIDAYAESQAQLAKLNIASSSVASEKEYLLGLANLELLSKQLQIESASVGVQAQSAVNTISWLNQFADKTVSVLSTLFMVGLIVYATKGKR
uniref:Uncharacterized protein n=1 Tax=viral metagenome TaxID=1070528 RepID=A0A6M3LP81_9ZZZZ